MSTNIERFGDVLAGEMKKTSRSAIPMTVEFGRITGNLSLSVDSLPEPIPPSDYMIDFQLSHETYYTYNELFDTEFFPIRKPHHHEGGTHTQESGDGYHTHDDGLHDHRVPSVFRRLKPGDRVLVVWVGFEPVIVAIIVAGTTITPN